MCKACGHLYERHIFGGMCLECGCQRCVYAHALADADGVTCVKARARLLRR